jgi:hypothetical protein
MLSVIERHDNKIWDAIVGGFKTPGVQYLHGYAAAFHLHGDGDPLLFYYKGETFHAINVVMRRDIAEDPHFFGKLEAGTYFDLSTPYGYGGWYAEGNDINYVRIYEAYYDYCYGNNIVSEFVRFDLFSEARNNFDGEIVNINTNIVRSLNLPFEEINMDFNANVRQNVKKAIKNELSVFSTEDASGIDDFLKIYYSTMEKCDANDYYFFTKSFFESLCQLRGNIIFYFVKDADGNIISTELILYDHRNCFSFLAGTFRECYGLRPVDIVKIEIIKWAQTRNLTNYVLGGGYGKNDGIYRNKKFFAPHGEIPFYVGRKIVSKEKYAHLLDIRISDKGFDDTSSFFPLYRA